MNLKQLEYFSAVAEAKSISLAARNLHVAQPPISRQLALLEDELGVCLFLRTNKGVELTEAGRSLYRQSQNLFQDMRMIVDSVRDINAGMRGLLKIGMIYSNISIALQYLKEFRAQYPQVELYVRLGSPGDLLEDLNSESRMIIYPCINVVLMGDDARQLLAFFDESAEDEGVQVKADLDEGSRERPAQSLGLDDRGGDEDGSDEDGSDEDGSDGTGPYGTDGEPDRE